MTVSTASSRSAMSLGFRHDIRNAGVANLALGADQPLRHGGGRHQKRPRDLVGLEAAQGAEGQRHLRFRGQRGVAAGEHQAQAVVGNFTSVVVRLFDGADQAASGVLFEFFLGPRTMPDAVDGLVAGRLDNPGAREFRHPGDTPLVHGRRKSLLRRLFRQIEIADEPDQCGDNPAPIGMIDSFNRGSGSVGHI